jgi:Ca2+-binding EF-hand superfamily protein
MNRNADGFISFDELLVSLRGEMSPARMAFIKAAFNKLDTTQDGSVTLEDLRQTYNATAHPVAWLDMRLYISIYHIPFM